MKNKIIVYIAIILLSACSKQPECNSEDAKALVLEILSDNIQLDEDNYNMAGNLFARALNISNLDFTLNQKMISVNKILFFKRNEGRINTIRTISEDTSVNACKCKGELTISDEAVDEMGKHILELYTKLNIWDGGGSYKSVPISYDLQITDEGDLYAEVDFTEDQIETFTIYSILKEVVNHIKNQFPNKVKFNHEYIYNSGTGDCSYEIRYSIDESYKVVGMYKQHCYFDKKPNKKPFKGTYNNKTITGYEGENKIEIDFENSEAKYYTLTTKLEDSTVIKHERENPQIYTRVK